LAKFQPNSGIKSLVSLYKSKQNVFKALTNSQDGILTFSSCYIKTPL